MLPPPPPPAESPKAARPWRPPSFLVRLAEKAPKEPHGKLVFMGLFLLAAGGLLTLLGYLFRDRKTDEFHVWWLFLGTGAVCLVAGGLWRRWRRE